MNLRLSSRFAQWTLAAPKTVAALLLLMTVSAALLLPALEFEPDISKLLPDHDPTVQLAIALENETALSRSLLIDVRGDDLPRVLPELVASLRESPTLDLVQATKDEFLGSAATAVREAPLFFVPDDTLEQLERRIVDERETALTDAIEELATDPITAAQVITKDPLGLRWILEEGARSEMPTGLSLDSPYLLLSSGKRALIRATGTKVPYDLDFSRVLLDDVEGRLGEFDVEWRLFGDYVSANQDSRRIRHDLWISVLTSTVLIILFLLVTMRHWVDAVLVFFPVVLGIFWALPLGGAILGPLTMLTVSSAAILAGLGVDFTIHYLIRYSSERRVRSHESSVRRTFRGIGRPLTASALTTAAAFLSLTTADFGGVRVLGILLALGLGLVFLAAILLLPLVLSRVHHARPPGSTQSFSVRVFDRLSRSKVAPLTCALTIGAALVGFALVSTRGIDFATDLDYLRPPEVDDKEARVEFEREIGFGLMPAAMFLPEDYPGQDLRDGLAPIETGGRVNLILGPHRLQPSAGRIERVQRFHLATAGWVDDTLTELDEAGFDSDAFRDGLGRFEAAFAAEPVEISVPSIEWEGSKLPLLLLYPDQRFSNLDDWRRLREDLQDSFGDEILTFQAYDLIEKIHSLVYNDLVRAATLTLLIAFGLASWLSGGIRPGLLAMLPVVCGFGVTLGALALKGTKLNMGNCVSIPFLLGIGVDHGIHLVAHFRRTGSADLGTCGTAIWRSSVTTVIGFGSLITAQTPAIVSMGMISILGVSTTALTSLLVLPFLWRWWQRIDPSAPAAGGTARLSSDTDSPPAEPGDS